MTLTLNINSDGAVTGPGNGLLTYSASLQLLGACCQLHSVWKNGRRGGFLLSKEALHCHLPNQAGISFVRGLVGERP